MTKREPIINLTDKRAEDDARLSAYNVAARALGVDPKREDAHDKNDR